MAAARPRTTAIQFLLAAVANIRGEDVYLAHSVRETDEVDMLPASEDPVMALTILFVMVALLLMGFRMMIPMLVATLVGFIFYFPSLKLDIIIQQMISGISRWR